MKEAVGGVIELKEGIQNISIAFSGSIALVVIIVIVLWCFFYKEKQICCKGSRESVVSYQMQPAASSPVRFEPSAWIGEQLNSIDVIHSANPPPKMPTWTEVRVPLPCSLKAGIAFT